MAIAVLNMTAAFVLIGYGANVIYRNRVNEEVERFTTMVIFYNPWKYYLRENIVQAVGGTFLALGIFGLIMLFLIIAAIVTNSAFLVMLWMICCAIFTVLIACISVFMIYTRDYNAIIGLVALFFVIYLLIVAYSYYKDLRDEAEEKKREKLRRDDSKP